MRKSFGQIQKNISIFIIIIMTLSDYSFTLGMFFVIIVIVAATFEQERVISFSLWALSRDLRPSEASC